MKTSTAALFLIALLPSPINAQHIIKDNETYGSQKGYAYEEKCFRYESLFAEGLSTRPLYHRFYANSPRC